MNALSRYVVEPRSKDDDFIWVVKEVDSGLDIKFFLFEEDAEKLAKHLRSGGGFNGWTPPFLLTDISKFIDINEEFVGFFA